MNKFLVLALITLSVSAIEMQLPSYMTFQDFKGVNIVKCIQDVTSVVKDITTLADKLSEKPIDINTDISDIITILQAVQSALPDCGANLNLAPLTQDFFAGMKTPICLTDLDTFVKDIKKTVADAQAKDISSIINDVTIIIGDVKKISADCKIMTAQPSFITEALPAGVDVLKCASEFTDVITVFSRFFTENSALRFNATHQINNSFIAVNEIMDILSTQCGLSFVEAMVKENVPRACITSLQDIIQKGSNILQYFSAKDGFNFMAAFTPISQTMAAFEQVKITCPFVKKAMDMAAANTTATA